MIKNSRVPCYRAGIECHICSQPRSVSYKKTHNGEKMKREDENKFISKLQISKDKWRFG